MIQAWRVPHPPKRGLYCLGRQPLVHRGFLQAWLEVAGRVLAVVEEVLKGSHTAKDSFQVYVTGKPLIQR